MSIFEILGGAALGSVLRGILLRKFSVLHWFFLIWGSGFAGIPLLMGALIFLTNGHFSFFIGLAFVLGLTILIVGLTPQDLFESLGTNQSYTSALIGGVMTMIGAGIVVFNIRQGTGIGLAVGGVLGIVGAVILMRAVLAVLHAEPQ